MKGSVTSTRCTTRSAGSKSSVVLRSWACKILTECRLVRVRRAPRAPTRPQKARGPLRAHRWGARPARPLTAPFAPSRVPAVIALLPPPLAPRAAPPPGLPGGAFRVAALAPARRRPGATAAQCNHERFAAPPTPHPPSNSTKPRTGRPGRGTCKARGAGRGRVYDTRSELALERRHAYATHGGRR